MTVPDGDDPRVVVAMLTYQRPDDLAAAIRELLPHVEAVPGAELLVVDNDVQPSARGVVSVWFERGRVRYAHEPRPGIAAARNRALREAAGASLLVFIDDDERPRSGWLGALIETYRSHQCVGVAGPVISESAGPIDPWIVQGGWFDRPLRQTGTVMPVVATNNLLLDLGQVRRLGVTFDEEFGLTGGSDTVFSLAVTRLGGRFVWCADAVVVDVVPASRATRSWVRRRAFRSGNSRVRAALRVAGSNRERAALRLGYTFAGLLRWGAGRGAVLVARLRRDQAAESRALRRVERGAGMLAGAVGRVMAEYTRS